MCQQLHVGSKCLSHLSLETRKTLFGGEMATCLMATASELSSLAPLLVVAARTGGRRGASAPPTDREATSYSYLAFHPLGPGR